MQYVSLLYFSAKPQSGEILGCALRHCTPEPFDSRRFAEACRAYRAYSQYPAWSRYRRSGNFPHADHDRFGWSPWQFGYKEWETLHAILPFVWLFWLLKNAATAFVFKHKKTIDATDISWPKTVRYCSKVGMIRTSKNWNYTLKLKTDTQKN